jgi:hypothetical protein
VPSWAAAEAVTHGARRRRGRRVPSWTAAEAVTRGARRRRGRWVPSRTAAERVAHDRDAALSFENSAPLAESSQRFFGSPKRTFECHPF